VSHFWLILTTRTHTSDAASPRASFPFALFIQQESGARSNVGDEARAPRAEEGGCRLAGLMPPATHRPAGSKGELDQRKLEVQPLLKMILCASNQYSMGCSRFNTSKVEGSYNPISYKL